MTRLRMRVSERLKGAQNTYAMLTTFNEIDMSGLMAVRNKYKVGGHWIGGWEGVCRGGSQGAGGLAAVPLLPCLHPPTHTHIPAPPSTRSTPPVAGRVC